MQAEKMSDRVSAWVTVKSKSHPDRIYYYNRATKASTWERPPELQDFEVPSHPGAQGRGKRKKSDAVVDALHQKPLKNAWSQSSQVASKENNKNRNGKQIEEKVTQIVPKPAPSVPPHTEVKVKSKPRTKMATPSAPSVDRVCPGRDTEEAMEVERWGEEEEVAMDIDVSEEDIAEMKSVRHGRGSPPQLSIEAFGIPADYTNNFSEKLYLVLDTNVLLSHLNFLEELKDYAIKGVGKPVLVIPWIVMQELDNHKSRSNGRLAGKARKAVRLLFSCFSSNHPRVRCQTMEETQTEVMNMAINNNDDRILHCCLLYQLKTQGHSGIVVLFSNDLNLCTKAMGNGVKAANRMTLFKQLRELCQAPCASTPPVASQAPKAVQMASPPLTPLTPFLASPTSMYHASLPPSVSGPAVSGPAVDPRLRRSREVNELQAEAESVLRNALSLSMKKEMFIAFGDLWPEMVVLKPPWGLKDLLFLIDRHWIAVYKHVLPPDSRRLVSELLYTIKNKPGMLTAAPEDILLFSGRATSLLLGFRDCSYYADGIQQAMSSLDQLSRQVRALKRRPLPLSRLSSSSSAVGSSVLSPATPGPHQLPVAHVQPLTQHPPPSSVTADPLSSLPLLTIPSLSTVTSSLSLQHMKEKLTQTVQSPPTDPSRSLEWVLGLIHDSVIYSQGMVQETLGSSQTSLDRANVSCFVRQIGELLSQIVASLQKLFEHGVNIPRMQEALVAFDFFLCQALLINSPLTIDVFFELTSIPEQRQLLETALKSYHSMLTELHNIDASFQL